MMESNRREEAGRAKPNMEKRKCFLSSPTTRSGQWTRLPLSTSREKYNNKSNHTAGRLCERAPVRWNTHRKVYSFYTASLFIQKSLPGTHLIWRHFENFSKANSYDWPWGFPASLSTRHRCVWSPFRTWRFSNSFFFRVKMRPQMFFVWKITARYISVRFFFSLGSWTTFTSELNSSLWTLPESNDATHFKPHERVRSGGRTACGILERVTHKTIWERENISPKNIYPEEKMSQSETVGTRKCFKLLPTWWRLTSTSGFRYTTKVYTKSQKRKKGKTYGMERRASARMREIVTR